MTDHARRAGGLVLSIVVRANRNSQVPVNEKTNVQLSTVRELHEGGSNQFVTIRGMKDGRTYVRTFPSFDIAQQWLSTFEATSITIISIL